MSTRDLTTLVVAVALAWAVWQLLEAARRQVQRRVWPQTDTEHEVLHRLGELVATLADVHVEVESTRQVLAEIADDPSAAGRHSELLAALSELRPARVDHH